MSRIADIKWNDTGNGPGINVSVFLQGCHFHCKGCFNQSTWNFDGGTEATGETISEIIEGIGRSGVVRNLSILGGEPLALENRGFTYALVKAARGAYPNIEIWLWTGYEWDELQADLANDDGTLRGILDGIDSMIVGRFHIAERDITLRYMGSRNQKLLRHGVDF